MKVIGINASPRRDKNTAALLDNALRGAAETAETERVDLFDLHFSGCVSCFACKRLGGSSFGRCACRDELTPVLEKCIHSDGVIVASPIYFGDVTGACRNFLERFLFPNSTYTEGLFSYPKRIPMGFIYTMNNRTDAPYRPTLDVLEAFAGKYIGETTAMSAVNTYQFDDYSKYSSAKFSETEKRAYREQYFPADCQKARELGRSLISEEPPAVRI